MQASTILSADKNRSVDVESHCRRCRCSELV